MTRLTFAAAPLLAVAAAFFAVPVSAEEPVTVTGRQTFQERVSFADLDLTRGSAQRALRNRVRHASDRVCVALEGPIAAYDYGAPGTADMGMNCVSLTYAAAEPQISDAIQRARSGQLMAQGLTVRVLAR